MLQTESTCACLYQDAPYACPRRPFIIDRHDIFLSCVFNAFRAFYKKPLLDINNYSCCNKDPAVCKLSGIRYIPLIAFLIRRIHVTMFWMGKRVKETRGKAQKRRLHFQAEVI